MGLRVNTNVMSLSAQRTLAQTNKNVGDNLRKLASGERITRAGDDAAGLAISENLKAQIRGMRQAKRNANDAISLIQTAEGGLSEVSNIIIRLRELAVQTANDTLGPQERKFTDIEFQNLKEEIDRISRSAEFNGIKLLDGTGGRLEFQVGIKNDPILDRLVYDGTGSDATLAALGLSADSVATKEGSQAALKKLDDALVQVNGVRAGMGALQNRLQSTVNNLGVSDENLSAANSRIRDVDVADETAKLTKNNILMQAGASVLSQANQAPNVALSLIKG
ncbi:flagellin [Bacteriovorax sp. Seq25_V]|uniref:flagellin N-terminal helical domain-containing protein n=1 Tax=Bacteriovorax sp. Seq25_V TaxID=1201288 RepID=UPI000389F93E|nr:flagellin [Bacteriovorax sp. Seq25_V]EQC43597.1 putative flagellin protein [Bacteriovorax sp. Seq25_V]